MGMKYNFMPSAPEKACKAHARDAAVSFKNTWEIANTIRHMHVKRAQEYLKNVLDKKECVPFRKFNGGVGRCSQAKAFGVSQGRWPKKSTEFFKKLLENVINNGKTKGLDPEKLVICHLQVNKAARTRRRRLYRAHGRISKFEGQPCHVEIFCSEKSVHVPKHKEGCDVVTA